MTAAKKTPGPAVTAAARAKARAAAVVQDAGAEGHIVRAVPTRRYRTDLVDPVLSFVVYGVPAPQGSKAYKGFRNGKPVLKETSEALAPWRDAVRRMARTAINDHTRRTGRAWAPLDEAVMVSAVVTLPATGAAAKRGDVYATSTPDLDKLQRAIGDALAPTPVSPSVGKGLPERARKQAREKVLAQRRGQSVLHDDSRIAVWDRVCKVYPSTTPDSLGYPGVTIRVWRMAELQQASHRPVLEREGSNWMSVHDLWEWARPLNQHTWPDEAARLWARPEQVMSAGDRVMLRGRGISEDGVRSVLRAMALDGPDALLEVQFEPTERERVA